MNSKLVSIITVFISIFSIVIVILFGLEAERIPVNVPVENIMFIDKKDGNENDKIKNNMINVDLNEQTYTMYYCFVPYNASNREISIYCSNENITATKTSEEGGEILLQFDLNGEDVGEVRFLITITSLDGRKKDTKYIDRANY